MAWLSLLAFAAAAAPADCAPPVTPPAPVQVGVRTHGHAVGGMGIAALEASGWSLTLLSPAGFALFSVAGPPPTVTTGLDAWRPWLARLPVERDLRMAFTPVTAGACRTGGGRLTTRATPGGWDRAWCGPGGHARAVREGETITLTDRRRGYALTLVVADAAG